MNERNDKLAKLLHERLADRRTDVPEEIWTRIEQSMAAIDAAERPAPVHIAPHHKRLGLRRVWYYGIAASMLLGLYLLSDRLNDMATAPEDLTASVPPAVEPAVTAVAPIVGQQTVVKPAAVRSSGTLAQTPMPPVKTLLAETAEAVETVETAETAVTTETVEPVSAPDDSGRSPEEKPAAKQPIRRTDAAEREAFRDRLRQIEAEERGRRSGRVSASLYASNVNGIGNRHTSPARVVSAGMTATELVNGDMDTFSMMASSNTLRRRTDTKLEHRVPFTVGASVRYGLTERWAVESGVTYTYLHSKSKSKGVFEYDISQELHYVGVPVAVSCKFVDGGRVEMYVKAGGAVERAVSAHKVYKVSNSTDNNQGRTTEKLDCGGVQLSAAASVGAELKLGSRVGIYAEAGAGYFFDNGQPMSYRTENPFSVTLQAGLRLHLGKNR